MQSLIILPFHFHYLDFNYPLLAMRSQLEHPFPSQHRSILQYPQPLYPIHRTIPARTFLSPSPHIATIPAHPQRKYSYSNEPPSPNSISNYNPQAPAFRQLRQRYIKSNSTPLAEERQSDPIMLRDLAEVRPVQQAKKVEELKYDKLKTSFSSSPIVYVDKKLNVTATSEAKEDKVKSTNNRIQCIIEELPFLEESKALFSQINHFKKKLNDLEDQNHRLKAQLFNQQVKNSTDLEKHREEEEKLIQENKSLKIELKKYQNECMMCRISEAQMEKKCQKLAQKNRQQQNEIARLKELLLWKQEEPESTEKSQNTYYMIN